MAQVFREVVLPWNGERHTMVPSVRLLRRIKSEGINNLTLARECMFGGADPSELAVVHRMFMAEAGVSISDEDSYAFVTGGDTQSVVAFQTAYVQSVVPNIDLGKKPEAPDQDAPKVTRAKKPAKTK
jgi:hypothetical protein